MWCCITMNGAYLNILDWFEGMANNWLNQRDEFPTRGSSVTGYPTQRFVTDRRGWEIQAALWKQEHDWLGDILGLVSARAQNSIRSNLGNEVELWKCLVDKITRKPRKILEIDLGSCFIFHFAIYHLITVSAMWLRRSIPWILKANKYSWIMLQETM